MPLSQKNKIIRCAVVVGVGASQGIGAAICRRFAKEGLLVYVVGRTESKLQVIVDEICQQCGNAVVHKLNDTNDLEVSLLFKSIKQKGQILDVVVHIVGGGASSYFLRTHLSCLKFMWQSAFVSGFLIGREATAIMREQGHGSIIFTDTSISLRDKFSSSVFTMGKSALRSYVLNLAKNCESNNLNIVLDGMKGGDRIIKSLYSRNRFVKNRHRISELNEDVIAENYWKIHLQKLSYGSKN
ncbi:SDR family NAD(P)-dependent oxidoreductase [Acinetobacter baumannii]|uniref:SDR family NAD(P)-dependent oxidoreductase n=1 Tax=Acinetobacter baumannii TaxID=470 RepID=UPI00321AE94E